jgi:hypothetical protein
MRYNALNATKPATTKQDVKRMYVVRLLHCIVPYLFLHCIMPSLSGHCLVLTLFSTFGRMGSSTQFLEQEYKNDHWAHFTESRKVI